MILFRGDLVQGIWYRGDLFGSGVTCYRCEFDPVMIHFKISNDKPMMSHLSFCVFSLSVVYCLASA